MTRPKPLILAGIAALALAGCQGSGRFDSFGGGRPQATAPVRPAPLLPAPTAPVQSAPLPPIGGQPPVAGGLPPIGSTQPIGTSEAALPREAPEQRIDPAPETAPIEQTRPPQVAARPEPRPSGPPSRTSVTGNWTAREAAGGSCRVTLSSVPTLDLYRASTAGCQSRELKAVNAWELRGDEVYLYETGGGVAARLKQSGGGFQGSAARTGAPITLAK